MPRRTINRRDPRIVLRNYLNKREPKVGRWLVGTWNAERKALKYTELAESIHTLNAPDSWIAKWQQDYSKFVTEELGGENGEWLKAMGKGQAVMVDGIRKVGGIPFEGNLASDNIKNWISQRGSVLATNLTNIQHDAIRVLLTKYAVQEPVGPIELARRLRPVIGLTKGQATAVDNLRVFLGKPHTENALRARLGKYPQVFRGVRRFAEGEIPPKVIEKQLESYGGRLQRRRAVRIARTELASAYNVGQLDTIKQAEAMGVFDGPVVKTWRTAGDEMVCDICEPLDDTTIELESEFEFSKPVGGRDSNRREVTGHGQTPPAHPDCRCSEDFVVLEE